MIMHRDQLSRGWQLQQQRDHFRILIAMEQI